MKHIIVYKTSQLWELDTTQQALKKAGSPFFVRTESLGGVVTALQASPTPGFGTRWLVMVPEKYSKEAENEIRTLPVSTGSDYKPFIDPTEFTKKQRIILASIIIIAVITAIVLPWLK
jgi:hypothetical protein